MAIVAFPSSPVATEDWRLVANTAVFTSPLSGATQTLRRPGEAWRASVTLGPFGDDNWRAFEAWLYGMGGRAGRVYYGPRHAKAPKGTASGTPLVDGASQTGSSLDTDGWDIGATMLAGDYIAFNVGSRRVLHIVTVDATADSGGAMTISIAPAIRTSPANNEAIITASPTCVMMLAEDNYGGSFRSGVVGSFTLDLVEALV